MLAILYMCKVWSAVGAVNMKVFNGHEQRYNNYTDLWTALYITDI